MTEKVRNRRSLLSCVRKGCDHCLLSEQFVTDTCKYSLIHLLADREGEVVVRDRRTGKTTEIVKMASALSDFGIDTLVVVRDHRAMERTRSLLMGTGVRIISETSNVLRKELSGREFAVFSDEVGSYISRLVRKSGSYFVQGFCS